MNFENTPDVSVVIPYFNQPEQLAQVLDDLLRQEAVSLEVFVVDDASERRCDAVIAGFGQKGLPVTLLRQPQRAYTLAARLRGMREIRGRWLAFMDSDDGLCSSTAYAEAVALADTAQADILHYGTLAPNNGGRLQDWHNAKPFAKDVLEGENIFTVWLASGCPAHSVWNKLYARSLYRRLLALRHDIPIYRIEDFYLTAHFLALAQRYAPCNIPVYKYAPPKGMHLEKAAARALDAMRMYLALPQQLETLGLAPAQSRAFRIFLRKMVTLNAGRMCRLLRQKHSLPDGSPDSEAVKRMRSYGSAQEFFLALCIVNASNARKLKEVCSGNTLSQCGMRSKT